MPITNLTGYTWLPNQTLNLSLATTFNISSYITEFKENYFGEYYSELYISSQPTFSGSGGSYTQYIPLTPTSYNNGYSMAYCESGFYVKGSPIPSNRTILWNDFGERATTLTTETLTFVGGTDIINTTLISWLQTNGTLTPPSYAITYVENGGSTVEDLEKQTELPDPLPTTTKAGNVFVAWFTNEALTNRAIAGTAIESDVTLYAKWYGINDVKTLLADIADAIRAKDGTTADIRDLDFPERIKAINI